MITIGLQGRMASGKSAVAGRFGALGGRVIDADAIAHEVLDEADVRAAVAARFGAAAIAADGRVDRAQLAKLVFGATPAHAAALAELEALVHPRVHQRIERALATIRETDRGDTAARGPVAVLDVPLLVKAGWDRVCDAIVRLECEDGVRRERLARRGISAEQQAARDAAWESQQSRSPAGSPPPGRRPKTFSVDTSRDLAYTHAQVDRIWHTLTGR